eukprot:TRINITY_DN1502_c0_g1_i2.p2 TRINITY_DN1502_c0_g1~~TRINITY_DN1502_c0_g1_i2.p2  ORF type:complete len:151 (+),score=44.42 TRINITY_DN1502_c0_g1_i2:951-1403(+)
MRVDGNDAVAVFNATRAARAHAVTAQEPVLLELMTYRMGHHTTSDDSTLYRTEEERAAHQQLCPIARFKRLMIAEGVWDEQADAELRRTARGEIVSAMKVGDNKKLSHPTAMFDDMYSELPWHLREQRDDMLAHIDRNRDAYNVSKYRGL